MKKSEINEIKKIMFEADPKDKYLHPDLKLIKPYPGMALKTGTIFTWNYEWPGYVADRRHSSEWTWGYFKPWIGTFFKKIKRKVK